MKKQADVVVETIDFRGQLYVIVYTTLEERAEKLREIRENAN